MIRSIKKLMKKTFWVMLVPLSLSKKQVKILRLKRKLKMQLKLKLSQVLML